jgi:hypothetical protein
MPLCALCGRELSCSPYVRRCVFDRCPGYDVVVLDLYTGHREPDFFLGLA